MRKRSATFWMRTGRRPVWSRCRSHQRVTCWAGERGGGPILADMIVEVLVIGFGTELNLEDHPEQGRRPPDIFRSDRHYSHHRHAGVLRVSDQTSCCLDCLVTVE